MPQVTILNVRAQVSIECPGACGDVFHITIEGDGTVEEFDCARCDTPVVVEFNPTITVERG